MTSDEASRCFRPIVSIEAIECWDKLDEACGSRSSFGITAKHYLAGNQSTEGKSEVDFVEWSL